MRLKTRFSLTFIGYTALVLGLFGGAYYVLEKRSAVLAQRQEQEKALEKLVSVCREAALGADALIALNYIGVVKKDPAVVAAACVDARGLIQAHSDPGRIGTRERVESGDGHAPVLIGAKRIGWARIGYDRAALSRQIHGKLWATLQQLLVVAAGTFLLAVFAALGLAGNLSRPIGLLEEAARAIGAGRLGTRVEFEDRADELGRLAREMDSMASRLKELDELKDQFISDVSHDLRNPLAAITMYVEYMIEGQAGGPVTKDQREMLDTILQHARRLGLYVRNILDSAKMKAGRMEYRLQAVDAAQVMENVRTLYAMMAYQQQVKLEVAAPRLPLLRVDPQYLEHILSNLVSNALKFTRPGGNVRISAAEAAGAVEIRVADTGKGIPPEDMPQLFKRFQSSNGEEAQPERNLRGTGLGLFIVKQSVEAMGGQVDLRSVLGKGTEVVLRLPPYAAPEARGGSHGR